ncbi:MAG TPA: asparagine synthase (glutamine-hydrolyzing), partial [Steroidobacteraceae bacterium]|nr:asparagine synthase (glutamine-hydrolyzing) [Steroidobacteraceae bacterium]
GHRRLAVLDLSPAGHQPMRSPHERFVITFNGEIYNHLSVRQELEKTSSFGAWRGHSDTETLLAAIEAWGVQGALGRCVGMFALAVWDRQERRLILARDRCGEKPLYYGRFGGAFLFASELKALRVHPEFRGHVDHGALALYLRHNYVPDPYCIYSGVAKLPAGSYVEVDAAGNVGEAVAYWSAVRAIDASRADPLQGPGAIDELERVLGDAVAGQMMADVPLGAFLSGGIDSSVVVALMQARSTRPVRTFTVGFAEAAYDESRYARAVAAHLGTEHTELVVSPTEARAVIPRLPAMYDEPFADSSQIPTALICQLARAHVTVCLSGDGGDEVFGGYTRYMIAERMWSTVSRIPTPLRRLAGSAVRVMSPDDWDRRMRAVTSLLPVRWRYGRLGDRLHKLGNLLAADTRADVYRALVSHWSPPGSICLGAAEARSRLTDLMEDCDVGNFTEAMMFWDLMTYLPGDILVKVDRAAMAVSLETRVPMLDHRVVEFAWRLPLELRVRDGEGKWLLRQLLYRHVPRLLIDRPKMGFGVPIDVWLRGPLRDWAETLLGESRLRAEGIFDPAPVRRKWQEHLDGRRNWAYLLWDVLMFQAWQEAQAPSSHSAVPAIPDHRSQAVSAAC